LWGSDPDPAAGAAVCAGERLGERAWAGEERAPDRVRAWEREYDCCVVERVWGWLGGTVVVTTVHRAECPVWSAR